MTHDYNKPSYRLTYEDAVQVHMMLMDGWFSNRIAAHFDVNPGRVCDVKFGRIHLGSYEDAIKRRRSAAA